MKEPIAHSGAWGIALIVIVLASWFLYRYLAPNGPQCPQSPNAIRNLLGGGTLLNNYYITVAECTIG